MHTGLYNRNRKGRSTGFVDPRVLLEDGLLDMELVYRLLFHRQHLQTL